MKTVMGTHRTPFYILFVLALSIALAACGGGGGTSAATPGGTGGITAGAATVQGQVSGTVFVAVDNDTNLEAGGPPRAGGFTRIRVNFPTGEKDMCFMF